MACVYGLAYAIGSVIRFNIRHTEPLLEAGKAPHRAIFFERTSDKETEDELPKIRCM